MGTVRTLNVMFLIILTTFEIFGTKTGLAWKMIFDDYATNLKIFWQILYRHLHHHRISMLQMIPWLPSD